MPIDPGSQRNDAHNSEQPKFANIPLELKERKQWCLWRLEFNPTIHKKPTKVPYSPWPNGGKAIVTNPATWGAFEQACAAPLTCVEPCHPDAPVSGTGFSGIGYVFSKDDPFVGLDLDDPNGDVEAIELHKRIIENFNSYTERSPSGKGFHIIVKGKIPTGRRRGTVEMYGEGRFFTMTGEVIKNADS